MELYKYEQKEPLDKFQLASWSKDETNKLRDLHFYIDGAHGAITIGKSLQEAYDLDVKISVGLELEKLKIMNKGWLGLYIDLLTSGTVRVDLFAKEGDAVGKPFRVLLEGGWRY